MTQSPTEPTPVGTTGLTRHRTDERIDDLSRRANRARQEEIINEIEVLLISDLATTD